MPLFLSLRPSLWSLLWPLPTTRWQLPAVIDHGDASARLAPADHDRTVARHRHIALPAIVTGGARRRGRGTCGRRHQPDVPARKGAPRNRPGKSASTIREENSREIVEGDRVGAAPKVLSRRSGRGTVSQLWFAHLGIRDARSGRTDRQLLLAEPEAGHTSVGTIDGSPKWLWL